MGIVYNDQQKPSDHLPWACVYELSQMYGLSPDVVENPVERITLINELNSGRPSIFWMKHDDSESGGHAIVLRGFFVNATTWSIWNPWYTTGNEIPVYEQFPIDGTYLPMTKHTSNWNLPCVRSSTRFLIRTRFRRPVADVVERGPNFVVNDWAIYVRMLYPIRWIFARGNSKYLIVGACCFLVC